MPALRALPLPHLLALAALISLAAPPASARQQRRQPAPQLVESVDVAGNRRLIDVEILKHVETRPGEPYKPEQMQRDFTTLMNLGFFDRRASRVVVELGQRGGVEVFFELRELPVIESVKFDGLREGDELVLRQGLRRKGLEMGAGGVLDMDKLNAAVIEMRRLLRGRGWHNVGVEVRVEDVSTTSVRLTLVVSGLPPKRRLDRKKTDKLRSREPIARHVLKLD